MKKSIKYAGIAAATLLAVAPVAAPVVSQAADTDTSSTTGDTSSTTDTTTKATNEVTNDNITNAVNSLKGVFTDVTYGDNSSNGSYPTALTTAQYDTYMTAAEALALPLLNGKTISSTDAAVLADADKANAQVKLFAIDSNSNKINFNDYSSLASSVASDNGSVTYKYTIKYNDKDGDAQTPVTGTFKLTNDNNYTQVKTLNVTYTDPMDVAYGSKTVDTKLSSTIDATVKDQNGNTIEQDNDASTTKAGLLYKNLSAAIKDDASTDVFSDSTFGNEDKTYYQPVTITIKANKMGMDGTSAVTAKSIVDNYLAGEDGYNVTVNGKQLSALTANTLKASDTNTLTFIRKVQVTQNASWTTEDVDGVVTTKSANEFYTLKNGDNNTISNRALAKNTAWKTNAKRTDQNGNVQYRVGADEWINADDVTFAKAGSDNGSSTTGSYTDVKALNGKVETAGPAGYYYPLFNDNGEQISNRGVAGLTSWYTDKSAKNADGVTVYHVATGEWIQGTNVTYTAY